MRCVCSPATACRRTPPIPGSLPRSRRCPSATRFSTARHANPDDDPYDTLVLDRTVRFHGQRVAAVIAEGEFDEDVAEVVA